jgi:asparagine synthase (glutamine-hydrolysing)
MCGIAGLALGDPRAPVDGDVLERMTDALRHRGPDGVGFHAGPGVGLGVRRLAIVDLLTGDQPLRNEDGSVVVVANGEIYNSPELRRELEGRGHRFRGTSDVEVIPHLYEELGLDAVARLRGMFALALWDAVRRRLVLARDRLGIKPLHYALTPGGIHFGSEQKAILAGGGVDRALDPRALDDVFRWGLVRTPRTLFAAIRRLPPGHLLVYEDGRASARPYWRLPAPAWREEPPRPVGYWAEALRAKLAEVVAVHVRSDVPVGAWLSTGIDSSGVVALAAPLLERPLATFTLQYATPELDETRRRPTLDRLPGFDLANARVPWSDRAFERYPLALWHAEDPSSSALEIPRLVLAEASARQRKVVLTGEGADEVLLGYARFVLDAPLRALAALPGPARGLALAGGVLPRRHPWACRMLFAPRDMTAARYAAIIGPLGSERRRDLYAPGLRAAVDAAPETEPWAEPPDPAWHPLDRLQRYELTIHLPDAIVSSLDRGSMAHGLEARVPFLDHELVELAARIPPAHKVRGLTEKHVLRRALRGVLPPSVLRRRKWGLRAPLARWLALPLPAFAEALLSPAALRAKGYFDPAAVRSMLARHRAGAPGEGSRLLGVLAIQLWDELLRAGRDPRTLAGGPGLSP